MTVLPRDGVEDILVSCADAFLDMLSPRNSLWSEPPGYWIFRGQANAEWSLTALAVRAPSSFEACGIRFKSRHPDPHGVTLLAPAWAKRKQLVTDLLAEFRDKLDRSGIPIPGPSPKVRLEEANTRSSNADPLRESFPLMALAQHHGLPTPLLDWTRRPWTAAYFAAVDSAAGGAPDAASLAVWALERAGLQDPVEGPMFYEAPGGTNPNLRVQDGLFTMLHTSEDDVSLEEHFTRIRRITGGTPRLRRVVLPKSESPKLLRLLAREGITGATMFPGADGVVKAMRERPLWDDWTDGL